MTEAARSRFDTWVFDLDNTLYPADASLYDAIGERMTAFIMRAVNVDAREALLLREGYFERYGATVTGLVRHHGVDAFAFLDDVHQVPLEDARSDPGLNARVAALPGQKIVFTNGARGYARAVVERLGLHPIMDAVSALEDRDLAPKPQPQAYEAIIERYAIDPSRAIFFDDHPGNLLAAAPFGFTTVLIGAAFPPDGIDQAAPTLNGFLGALR